MADKTEVPDLSEERSRALSAISFSLLDQQLQLFQPFHLWHTLPGFSFNAFLNPVQKVASFFRASLLKAFFILYHLLSVTLHWSLLLVLLYG
jgi:hypothetical protein